MAQPRIVKLIQYFAFALIGAIVSSGPNVLFNLYANYIMKGKPAPILALLYIPLTVILMFMEIYFIGVTFGFQLACYSKASFGLSIFLVKLLQLIALSFFHFGITSALLPHIGSVISKMLIMPIGFFRPGLIGIFYTAAYIGGLINYSQKRYKMKQDFLDWFRF